MIYYTRKYKNRHFPGFYLLTGQIYNLPEEMKTATKDEMQAYMSEQFGEAEYIGPAAFDEMARTAAPKN